MKSIYIHRVRSKGRVYFYARSPDGKVRLPLGQDVVLAEQMIEAMRERGVPLITPDSAAALIAYVPKIVHGAKQRSKSAGLNCDLTSSAAITMLKSQRFCCAVTRMQFNLTAIGGRMPFAPSIDRIKAGSDYILENVRLTTQIANVAMGSWGEEPLRALGRAVYRLEGERV